ncbi:hypothetical protein [Xenorhabdus lircayensis]|uniref:Transposase n=1 Tax=Xenorhabdus lircayensis TaxID=2763499 RepID=A0ABS0U8R6_9GAMM|nr:hypothetical protein [Xenorhabdus lircayensis]MBI6549156.1 hypothetical protein [Xenorhabdus lircayensis]
MSQSSSYGYKTYKYNAEISLIDFIQTVKKSATNHWQHLLPACGIDVPLPSLLSVKTCRIMPLTFTAGYPIQRVRMKIR